MSNAEQKKPLRPADLVGTVLDVIARQGEMMTDEVIQEARDIEPEADAAVIEKAIKVLDRRGWITRQNQVEGWQVTAGGRDAVQQISAKQLAPFVAPYANYAEVCAVFELLAPSLGPLTMRGGEGEQGKAVWPRLPDASIILYGGWIRAAMTKAADRLEAVVAHDLTGKPKALPKAAWSRISISPVILAADTATTEAVRRPLNVKNQAVGELLHEALAIGTRLEVRGRFPLSHFPEPFIRTLFEETGRVGISPAGSGRGGIWGVARLCSLVVGGRDNLNQGGSNGHAVL